MQILMQRILALFLLTLFVLAAVAAPLKDDSANTDEITEAKENETPVTSQEEAEEATQTELKEETPVAADVESDEPTEPEGNQDRGNEVTNYEEIQVDKNSEVTSEKKSQNLESKEDDDDEEEEDEDILDPGVDEMLPEVMLTSDEARELLLELQDPVDVAKFVVETDDAEGFLRALRLLVHDGYITPEEAYSLKDEVTVQLRNLLMLQQVELSRALYETYEPEAELETPNLALENILYEPEPQQIDFYDYGNMLNQGDAAYVGPLAENLYEAYQEQIEEESTQAIAEIAEILAQRISKGEISPEEGAKIMRKVIQLLPESYWGENDNTMSSDSMSSEYMVDDGFINGEDSVMESSESEAEEGFSDEDDEEAVNEPIDEDDFEEQLLEEGPGGLVREIDEEDANGDEDAKELEGEAEHLADELENELLQGTRPIKEKTMKIERPGAKAIVKVGPSNDVTTDDDDDDQEDVEDELRQNWKEMSLLFDKDIPEDLLQRLGISLEKNGKDVVDDVAEEVAKEIEHEEEKEAEAVDN